MTLEEQQQAIEKMTQIINKQHEVISSLIEFLHHHGNHGFGGFQDLVHIQLMLDEKTD